MTVEVIVPWRPGDADRQAALQWVLGRYAERHPDWRVSIAEVADGPWCKARAVAPAVEASTADVILVADADVWCDGLADAAAVVADGAPWAIPHTAVYRLDRAATLALLTETHGSAQNAHDLPLDRRVYKGMEGGGFVMLPRTVALAIPLDHRFVGWGQEDESWAYALRTLAGAPWRGKAPLVHLWHEPQTRLTPRRGSDEGWRLMLRYAHARGNPAAMAALIGEARHVGRSADEPSVHAAAALPAR